MKSPAAMIVLMIALAASAVAALQTPPSPHRSREHRNADKLIQFRTVDVFVDSRDQPLAAYQLEFKASQGDVKIVGIEGGEHGKFKTPPYYDPQAMQQERVIIAAFSTAHQVALPTGRTRIATIHVQVTGDVEPEFVVTPTVVATTGGKNIQAQVEAKLRETSSSKQDDQS